MKTSNYIVIVVSSLLILTSFSPMLSFADVQFAPILRQGASTSTNWSGYAVTAARGSVTDVKGSWVVPTVTGTSTKTQYSSFWVGIDGYSSNTVEQIGTDSDISNGQASYYAWFEFYPKPAYYVPITVKAGDAISAEVQYTGTKFVATIKDITTQASFSVSAKVNALRTSAEWVVEAPWSGGVLPLANFGTVSFSSCTATIKGYQSNLPIGSFPDSSIQSITMVTSTGTPKDAITTPISVPGGSSFSITWVSSVQ